MLRSFRVSLLCLSISAFGAEDVETWVISGQSNACGRAAAPGAEGHEKVFAFDAASKKWVQAAEPLNLGGAVGPWLKAAAHIGKAGIPLRLTGYASGGQPIKHWDEKQSGATGLFAALQRDGINADVFLWYQGESDGKEGMDAETYKAKLKDLVERVRTAAKNPQMIAVIVQLGLWKNAAGDFMPIREAERQFVLEDKNAILVPALGRAMGDYVHLSKDGYFELGDEIARALLKTRYKREKESGAWPGPVLDSAVLGADGKSIVAHFAEVSKLGGALAEDFGVLEGGVLVKVTKVDAQKTRVALTLERAIKLPAKLVYGIGQAPAATLVDEAGNRAPAVQLEVVSGALPDDKETQAPNGAGKTAAHLKKK